MDRADPAFHVGFRWEPLSAFAHCLEKNGLSLKLLLHIGHLLPLRKNRTLVSSPGIEPGLRPSHGRVRFRHTPRTELRRAAI